MNWIDVFVDFIEVFALLLFGIGFVVMLVFIGITLAKFEESDE
jgi:hypothetical protein